MLVDKVSLYTLRFLRRLQTSWQNSPFTFVFIILQINYLCFLIFFRKLTSWI